MIAVNKKIGNQRVTFNPDFFKRAYESYKNGNHRDLIAMMKEAETDYMVSGCLQGRRAGFMRDVQITPFDEDNSADIERGKWYEGILKRLRTRSFFKAIMQARAYKYSVIDFDWEVIGGRQVPVRHKFFDQKYFVYDKDDDSLKIDWGKTKEDIPETALICESEDMAFMIPVLSCFILKEHGLETWASFIENWGEAMIIGYYPPGASDEVKDEVDKAVNQIGAASRGSAPKGTDIDIKETSRNTGDHKDFTEAADKGISISILGHANATQQSAGMHIGENQAPFKPMQFISIDDLFFIDENIDRLIQIIHDRNFNDGRYPQAMTSKPDQIGLDTRIKLIDMAWRHGASIPPEEYRRMGIRIDNTENLQKTDPFQL